MDDYRFLNVHLYEDTYKHKEPLAGIRSSLVHYLTDSNFFISCNFTLTSVELIKYIIELKDDKLIGYCFTSGRHYYLVGIYRKELLPEIERIFVQCTISSLKKNQHFPIRSLLMNIEAEIIYVENLPFFRDELFFNLNTPEDFELLKRILAHQ